MTVWINMKFKEYKSLGKILKVKMGFPCGSVAKNPPANAGDTGSVPGLGRSPGQRIGKPLQYSCLGNPMDRGAWQAKVCWIAKSQTQLSD